LGVRSLTSQLATEVADVARRKRFLAAGLQTEPHAAFTVGSNGNGSAKPGGDPVPVVERPLARVPDLPELAAQRPDQDNRWKPPGGVAARFSLSKREAAADRTDSSHTPVESVDEPAPQPHEEGSNGTTKSTLPTDSNADAITIELKSS